MVNGILLGKSVYVDANTLIYAIETPTQFPGLQRQFIEPLLAENLHVVTSWITLAEVLIRPISQGDAQLESYYRQLVQPSAFFRVIAVDESIASSAAVIRSTHGIKLADAIHIATGQWAGCNCFLTRDSQWAKTGIAIVDPDDL